MCDQTLWQKKVQSKTYKVLVKNGDDMRQDQIVLSLIEIFNIQLKKIGFDLHFTKLKCLACSKDDGMMEIA